MSFTPIMPGMMLLALFAVLTAFTIVQAVLAGSRAARLHWAARCLMVLLLFAMALRPSTTPATGPEAITGDVDVYFVVDTTSSMAAEDWDGGEQRLDGVRADITSLLDDLAGARFSLVTFDAATVQRVPLTTDPGAVEQSVAALTQEITAYSSGSSISAPVEKLTALLRDDELEGESTTIVYYLGDGEQTSDEEPEPFTPLREYVDGGAVLGYGTSEGGRMKEYEGLSSSDASSYITDPETGTDAVSRIDEEALAGIADQLGVDYLHRDAASSVDAAADGIRIPAAEETGESSPSGELTWLLAVPFGVLALLELVPLLRGLRELRGVRRRG